MYFGIIENIQLLLSSLVWSICWVFMLDFFVCVLVIFFLQILLFSSFIHQLPLYTRLCKSIYSPKTGINWSVCSTESLGTSHSTQGQDDSSSSSTAGLYCTVLHSTIYRCAVHPYIAINIYIRYGSE